MQRVEVCEHDAAEHLWQAFVAQRRPCVFKCLSQDLKHLPRALSVPALRQHAGHVEVAVEEREPGGAFGRGCKRRMRLADALDAIQRGDESLYLSTQDAPVDVDGHPRLLAEPLATVRQAARLPLRPACMGALVPQAINLWLGHAPGPAGTSSGLHHDYHDNLYLLLEGRKHFRLFPPKFGPRMYTHGRMQRIHENGRIVYEDSDRVNADGSDPSAVAAWHAKRQADLASGAACKRAQQSSRRPEVTARSGTSDTIAPALEDTDADGNDALEAALESALASALESGHGLSSSSDSSVSSAGGGCGGEALGEGAHTSRRDMAAPLSDGPGGEATGHGEPNSFSQVDLAQPLSALVQRFPDFPHAHQRDVVIEAGQMLYLPAGWFHEVTSRSISSSRSSSSSPKAAASGPGACHVAVNYWFHPPDAIEAGTSDSRYPYRTDFWPSMWNARIEQHAWPRSLQSMCRSPAPDGGVAVREGSEGGARRGHGARGGGSFSQRRVLAPWKALKRGVRAGSVRRMSCTRGAVLKRRVLGRVGDRA